MGKALFRAKFSLETSLETNLEPSLEPSLETKFVELSQVSHLPKSIKQTVQIFKASNHSKKGT
jgi:hypothetical protein